MDSRHASLRRNDSDGDTTRIASRDVRTSCRSFELVAGTRLGCNALERQSLPREQSWDVGERPESCKVLYATVGCCTCWRLIRLGDVGKCRPGRWSSAAFSK